MKRYISGIIAVVIAVGVFAFTKPSSSDKQNSVMANYYFEFVGTHGDESDPAEWQEISKLDYDNLTCGGESKGCSMATTSVNNPSAPLGQRVISSVTVDNNDVPQQTTENFEVKNRP